MFDYSSILIIFVSVYVFIVEASPFVQFSTTDIVKKRSSKQKYIFAHHIVGNTYPYTLSDWTNDIALAQSWGIDAFALNLGTDNWETQQVANAYVAAEKVGSTFKLFLSFDMSVFPCSQASDATALTTLVKKYASHPNQFKYPSDNLKPLVSTFSGESCTFGQSSPSSGWQSQFIDILAQVNKIFFIPAFFVDPSTFNITWKNVLNGSFQWNSAWQIDITTSALNNILVSSGANTKELQATEQNKTAKRIVNQLLSSTQYDQQYIKNLNGKPYMASVAPWFFTHYPSGENSGKNFVYLSENLWPERWMAIINARSQIDLVEIISWNDYGESHYIGPIEGAQPNSQAWTNGKDHTAWGKMTNYFASAYKTGVYPTIMKDNVYLWARKFAQDAHASSDPVGAPDNYQLMQDVLYAVVLATKPCTVQLSTAADPSQNFQSYDVQAGMTQLSIPLTLNGGMNAKIIRDGVTIVDLHPDDYKFANTSTIYDFNAYVSAASS